MDLIVRVDGVVDGTETAFETTARALREEDLKILVLVDGVQTFVDTLATELVLRTKTIRGFAAKTNHAVAFPFFF